MKTSINDQFSLAALLVTCVSRISQGRLWAKEEFRHGGVPESSAENARYQISWFA
jgi:hypothetical protein